MIRSMTGFGKAEGICNGYKINIEIRSLNSKQLDLNVKLPSIYKELEMHFRKKAGALLTRGKIELSVFRESSSNQASVMINEEMVNTYFAHFKRLSDGLGEKRTDFLELILKMPDVLKGPKEELSEEEKTFIFELLERALTAINQFRGDEGAQLEIDLKERVNAIQTWLEAIKEFEEDREQQVKNRLEGLLNQLDEGSYDKNRFEQELIYYMEKFDINEEKVRLKSHLDYFSSALNLADAQGKKLGFIGQEIGREINTIGSKANHASMQKCVVQMKDELEKIKEQCLNIL